MLISFNKQNFYIKANKTLLSRIFIPMPIMFYQAKLYINANQTLLDYTSINIRFKKSSKI